MNMNTVNCNIPHAAHTVYKWILRQYSIICFFLVLTKTIICLFSCFNWCFSILHDHHITKFYSLIESLYFCLSNKYFWTNSLHWTFSGSGSKSLNKVRNSNDRKSSGASKTPDNSATTWRSWLFTLKPIIEEKLCEFSILSCHHVFLFGGGG